MKNLIYIFPWVFMLLMFPATGAAQNTFEFLLGYPVVKWTANALEDEDGNFIALISEQTGVEYAPNESTKAYLLKFSPYGDTLTKHYQFGDTLFNFTNIAGTANGGYLITGFSTLPDSDELYLLLMEVDGSLDPVWVKHHDLSGYLTVGVERIFPMHNGYILSGFICNFPCAALFPFFVRIDNEGNIINTVTYQYSSISNFEYLLTRDSSRIWLFAGSSLNPINGPSRAVFDTAFNHLYSEPLPEASMWMFTAKLYTDSTFLLGYNGQRPGAPYQDDELFVGLYDTLLNNYHLNYFGAQDTNDYPGRRRSIDFRHPDSIFFAGFKNLDFGYPSPNAVSWIMTGQLDNQLQPRYLHFIGGDAYYETHYILAASGGGCLICAGKWDPETQVYDLLFLKLNNKGLLVGSNPPGISLKRALLYPNPATDWLYLETGLRNAELVIYRIDGIPVLKHQISETRAKINVSGFAPGPYIYVIATPDGYSEDGKFIKQ